MFWDAVLSPLFELKATDRFQVVELRTASPSSAWNVPQDVNILLNWNCPYTGAIIRATAGRRPWCKVKGQDCPTGIEVADFEHILWEEVIAGKHSASSYLVRKGLSRKAQLSLQIRRFVAKHPQSVLCAAVPKTAIIETWNAFEDVKIDICGLSAAFDLPSMSRAPLRERLHWALSELHSTHFASDDRDPQQVYILKPSVTNKGADISLVRDWEQLLDALEAVPDQREWVLQHYLADPLTVSGGHKFHLRVYVLCVGALRVFVFQDMLVLIAARPYRPDDLTDLYGHLTNTARAAESDNFDETKFVKLLSDLPSLIRKQHPQYSQAAAEALAVSVRQQINTITAELFAAYENEYSVFCPMPHCFELFGLDFMVSEGGQVSLLEVNPGPDFVQTGERLRGVIVQLWEQTFRIVADTAVLQPHSTGFDELWERQGSRVAPDFRMVYAKEWSVSKLQGGAGMTLR